MARVRITNDAWMAQQREIARLREEGLKLAADYATDVTRLTEERDVWKRHANNLRDRNIKLWREVFALRALIDKHNDECRECPVIDLKQDGEPQASDEQARLEVDLAEDQKHNVEQQDDERQQSADPSTG